MLCVGGLRPRHVIGAYGDLGMQITGTGYEFSHADNYQRTPPLLKDGTVIYDDATEHEMEELVRYEGFPIFARDMDMAINSPTWKMVKDPFAA